MLCAQAQISERKNLMGLVFNPRKCSLTFEDWYSKSYISQNERLVYF